MTTPPARPPCVSLVLPTYEERENLAPLLERVSRQLAAVAHEIIVVDDDSPDRTWEEAERLRGVYPQLRVIRRRGERGLSAAVVRGFREARGDVLVVMDADLQHDETVLGPLIDALENADFAVASRAAPGGGLGRWRLDRRLASWFATWLARAVVDAQLSDPMSGYFAMRRELFARVDGDLHPQGFKILLYLYVHARRRLCERPITVREVGYVFRDRLHGKTKLTAGVMWDYVKMLRDLRRSGSRRGAGPTHSST